MTLPKIDKYKHTVTIGTGATFVEIGPLTIWFSYAVPVAFQVGSEPRVISVNYGGNGTGAHINLIDRDKSKRVKREEFEARLNEVVEKVEVALMPRP